MSRKLQAFAALVGLLVLLQAVALITEGVSRQTLVVVSEVIIFAIPDPPQNGVHSYRWGGLGTQAVLPEAGVLLGFAVAFYSVAVRFRFG